MTLKREILLNEDFKSTDCFCPLLLLVAPCRPPIGPTALTVVMSVCGQFTFQQCSACHETLGATNTAVAFPVVPVYTVLTLARRADWSQTLPPVSST